MITHEDMRIIVYGTPPPRGTPPNPFPFSRLVPWNAQSASMVRGEYDVKGGERDPAVGLINGKVAVGPGQVLKW